MQNPRCVVLLTLFVSAVPFVVCPAGAAPNAALFADEARPSWIVSQYPLHRLHMTGAADRAQILDQGKTTFSAVGLWSSTSILRDRYRVDAETRELDLFARHAVRDDIEVEMMLPLLWRGGGVLDGPIDSFHEAFGFPDGGRDRVDNDSYAIFGSTDEGTPFRLNERGSAFGNLELGVRTILLRGHESATMVHARFSLPTAQRGFGHEGVDTMLAIVHSFRWYAFVFDSGISGFLYGQRSVRGIPYEGLHPEGFMVASYRVNSRFSASLGLIAQSSPLSNIPDHPEGALYLDVSARYQIAPGRALTLLVRENPGGNRGSTDIVFGIGVDLFTV